MLRRVPEPKRKTRRTRAKALAAIEKSRLKFTATWDGCAWRPGHEPAAPAESD